MISIETVCFLLVVVGSLGLFYYLGFLAGEDATLKEMIIWNEERDDENE